MKKMWIALSLAALLVGPMSAGTLNYQVTLDTTALTQGAAYTLDFQLIGTNGNTANVANFELDTLSNFFNEAFVPFQAGSEAQFLISATNIGPPGGGFPDELSMFLLDGNGNPVSTADPADALFYFDITGDAPNIQTFGGTLPAPDVTPIPEPGTGWLCLCFVVVMRKLVDFVN